MSIPCVLCKLGRDCEYFQCCECFESVCYDCYCYCLQCKRHFCDGICFEDHNCKEIIVTNHSLQDEYNVDRETVEEIIVTNHSLQDEYNVDRETVVDLNTDKVDPAKMETIIKDCIYRYIVVPPLCKQFIDTREFQRLRRIRQLGVAHYTYPSAVHTRFEHSLGVMHLAGLAVDNIARNADITVEPSDKDLIMLAGLLHDAGHMAFSHMFDDVAGKVQGLADEHEHRSLGVLATINQRRKCISDNDETRVGAMILGEIPESEEGKRWMYQIVNNKLCDVDVDKMDYLQRDAYHTGIPGFQPDYVIRQMTIDTESNLAFKRKTYCDIEHIFVTRKRMFSNVYFHKTTEKIDAIYRAVIADAISRLNSERIIYHFEDDFQAETYLRKEYPVIFEHLDVREINKAVELSKAVFDKRHASYVTGCNDLETVMSRIIFV